MDANQALAELLQEHKKKADLSEEALALESAIPRTTLQRYLKDPGEGRLGQLDRLSTALGAELEDLLREARTRAKQPAEHVAA